MSNAELTRAIERWWDHPQLMVRELFDVTPDGFQDEVLSVFPKQPRIAMLASKGPGKTCLESWCAWNFLLTRPHCNIAAVSITAENLADNLWKEMSKWQQKSDLLMNLFEWKKTRIERRGPAAPTWWMSARSWPRSGSQEDQANTLAGLHADYVMFILDESGGIPDSVMVSADAALSSCIEGHILQGGNPTHREGPLWRAATARDRWYVVEINGDPDNPKRSPRISIEWARDQIREYGVDNPWVLVNVFGRFPPSSLNTLIGPDEIMDATKRHYHPSLIDANPRVLGIDVALYGDDASVIFPRQGLVAFAPMRYRNVEGPVGAGIVSRKIEDWEVDATFIDNTGGFGTSWTDQLRLLGKAPVPVLFSQEPNDRRYYNKRAEIYFLCCQWIKDGGQLPPIETAGLPEVLAALTRTTYTFKGDRLVLEPKEMVKARLGYSPDDADALALTFSQPVSSRHSRNKARSMMKAEYDPFAEFQRQPRRGGMAVDYDPYGGA